MKLTATLGLASALVIATVSWQTRANEERSLECRGDFRIQVSGFSHVVSYGERGAKVRVEAREACSSRFDRPYELRDVKLTVWVPGREPYVSVSEEGTLSVPAGRLLLHSRGLPAPLPIWVDLRAGVVKSPAGLFLKF